MADPSRQRSASPRSVAPAHVVVIEARYNDEVTDQLLAGASAVLAAAGATFDVVTVPGALEIAPALAILLQGSIRYDAAVAIGCVVRSETYHFEVVANESARGLTDLAIQHAFPTGNAILTVENEAQAQVRADPARGNKGGEAAEAALRLLQLKRQAGNR